MTKLVFGAAALTLCATLTACGGSGDPTDPPIGPRASAPPRTSATVTGGATSSGPSGTATSSDGTGTPGATRTTSVPVIIDQSTPEGVVTSWLGSMVSGDSTAVCGLMASGGKPIAEIEGAGASCSAMIAPTVSALKKVGSAFAGLRVTGATVAGDRATFERASTQPALAAPVIRGLKVAKIGSRWYVTP